MKVNVGITHKCELLASGRNEDQEKYLEFIKLEEELHGLLDPCNEEEYDSTPFKEALGALLEPCEENPDEIYIEFVVSDKIAIDKTVSVTSDPLNKYRLALPSDGLYEYYKVKVLTKEAVGEFTDNRIYWDGSLKYGNSPLKIEDLPKYVGMVGKGAEDYYCEDVFSLCKLEHCVAELQRQTVLSNICNCGKNAKGACNKGDSLKDQRDFLFISLNVLQWLVARQRYQEATEILDALASCGSLCKDLLKKPDCGCGN